MKKNKFFDINDLKEKTEYSEFGNGSIAVYLNHQLDRIDYADDLVRMPADGEIFFLHSEKDFSIFTFIPWVARRQFIEELFISTAEISAKIIEALLHLLQNGRIGSIVLLISKKEKKENPEAYESAKFAEESNGNFKVKFGNNNSRIGLVKAGMFHLVLEGSGNWDDKFGFNQFVLTNQERIYNFRKQIFNEII